MRLAKQAKEDEAKAEAAAQAAAAAARAAEAEASAPSESRSEEVPPAEQTQARQDAPQPGDGVPAGPAAVPQGEPPPVPELPMPQPLLGQQLQMEMKVKVPSLPSPMLSPLGASQPMVVENTKKDASSVLGILQQAQDNIARERAGGARVAPPGGGALAQSDGGGGGSGGSSSGGSWVSKADWEAIGLRIQSASGASSESRRSTEREALALLSKLEPPRIADLVVRLHGVESMRTAELLDDLCQALTPLVTRITSQHLTRITGTLAQWTLAVAGGGDDKVRVSEEIKNFFAAVSTEVSLRLMDVAPGDLSRIATALASVGLAGFRLFASLARAAVARTDRFTPAELVALVTAFDKSRFFHTALFEALARCLKATIKHVTPRDMLSGMRALATCGIRDEELGQAVGDSVPKKASQGTLTAQEFCSLAWTFCALDLHHDRLFRAVFRALEDAAVVASETLCQLYEIHLTLKACHHG